jgi:hypothetical protein
LTQNERIPMGSFLVATHNRSEVWTLLCSNAARGSALQRSHLRDRDGYRKRNNMQQKETAQLTAVRRAEDYESNPLTGLESRRVVDHWFREKTRWPSSLGSHL